MGGRGQGPGRRRESARPVFVALEQARQPLVRRDGDRELPAGPKAVRTRAQLVAAARGLFAEHGYQATSVAQIIGRAGVSFGTFYQYFRDKSEVLAALVVEYVGVLMQQTRTHWATTTNGREDLERMIASFVVAYAEGAELSGVWEEASHLDAEMAALRRDLGRILTEDVERELLRGGRAGHCRSFTAREAALAARALAGMVDRFCYVTYVFDPPDGGPPAPDEAAALLASLWAGAIGLPA